MEPRRSIQDIIPPARSKSIRPSITPTNATPPPMPPTPPTPIRLKPERPRSFTFIIIVALIFIAVAGAVGLLSTVFHRAYVSATPNHFESVVQGSFASSIDSPVLPYTKVMVEDTVSKSLPATGTKKVEERASGTITIYNAYSTGSQRLITNTRFQSKDGLVYRIHSPVVVPGYTMKAGVKVPGSFEVTVYADEAGDKYNIGLDEFTLPGLKGSDQYTLITARSKTAMAGGFVGDKAVVDAKARSEAITELKAELERTLRAKVLTVQPEGSLVFDNALAVVYAEGTDKLDGDNAIISVSGTGVAPAFSENALAKSFARIANIGFEGDLSIENPNELALIIDKPENVLSEKPIQINVSGTVKMTALFDPVALSNDLAGKNKAQADAIRPGYPALESLTVRVYPFWMSTIPEDVTRVKVEVITPGTAAGVDAE